MRPQQEEIEKSLQLEYFCRARQRVADHQLRPRGIVDGRVLQAMASVPREAFVSESVRDYAYDDCPLATGFGQTISQPFAVAFPCEAPQLQSDGRVLEVGTGPGYAAAVLSQLVREVYAVERISGLATHSMELWLRRVELRCPEPFVEQLSLGGHIVISLGKSIYGQAMC